MTDLLEARHPIRVVVQRTGLSAAALRAWERRYGVVTPSRSEGGQRLYSDADIRRLQLLATATDAGRNISLIAGLGDTELEELIDEDRSAPGGLARPEVLPDDARLSQALTLIEELRTSELEALLMRAAVELRPHEFVDGLMVPLLQEVGRGWQAGRLSPSTEHIASGVIRRFLEWMSGTNQADEGAPLAVTGTPAGQRHEFGALLAAVLIAYEGWRVRFLGPDLPAPEIAGAAEKLGASLVALSAVHPRLDAKGVDEVLEVRRLLPPTVHLVIGGAGADPHDEAWSTAGINHPKTLSGLRHWLEGLREEP